MVAERSPWFSRRQNPAVPFGAPGLYDEPEDETFIDPIADYPTGTSGTGGQAVIGGFVYRGELLPALQGKYVFGDFNRQFTGPDAGGRMMFMDVDEPGPNQVFDLMIVGDVAKPTANLHGIAEDANGELYYLLPVRRWPDHQARARARHVGTRHDRGTAVLPVQPPARITTS